MPPIPRGSPPDAKSARLQLSATHHRLPSEIQRIRESPASSRVLWEIAVGMERETAMHVLSHKVTLLPRRMFGVDVDGHSGQLGQVMQQLVAGLHRYAMSTVDVSALSRSQINLGMQPISRPPRPHFCDGLNSWDVARRVSNIIDDVRVNPVKEAQKKVVVQFAGTGLGLYLSHRRRPVSKYLAG